MPIDPSGSRANPAALKVEPIYGVETSKPVAYDSPDHIQPWGTARDNSSDLRFNWRLYKWRETTRISVLDLGCSGGGFVKSILDGGGTAVGIEGSDYSLKNKRAEWATIPGNLFTADITAPFQVSFKATADDKPTAALFDIVTAWEVMEHIRADQLPQVAENILQHLAPGGVFIASISPFEEVINDVSLHQTLMDEAAWMESFAKLGLVQQPFVRKAFASDWVRGGDNAPGSFYVTATAEGDGVIKAGNLQAMIEDPIGLVAEFDRKYAWRDLSAAAKRAYALKRLAFAYAPRPLQIAWKKLRGV